jgi:hypothetical protein
MPSESNIAQTPRADLEFGQARASADPALRASASSEAAWWLLLVALIAGALCEPYMHAVWSLSDEGMLLRGAERMLRGDRLYADFFEFLPPGGFVLTAAWLKVAGISLWSARQLAVLTIIGIAGFTFLACRRACKNTPLSAVLATGWVVMSQGMWTQLSHHWFTTLFSMIAAWAALVNVGQARSPWRWPLVAGAAAGAAAMVTPIRGALTMLAMLTAFLNPRRRHAALFFYLLGGAAAPAALIAFVVRQHAFAAALDDIIRFTGSRYASIESVPFGSWADQQNFLLKALFPLAALLTVFLGVRDWRGCLHDRVLRCCGAAGLAGFIGCFPRPDMVHIGFAAPMALPLLACCITRLWSATPRYVVAGVVFLLCMPSVQAFSRVYQNALRADMVATPRGNVAFLAQPGAPELLNRIAAAPQGEVYFFYPYIPLLPFLAARQDAARNDIFMPGYTTQSQYRDACVSVMRRASWLVIDRNWTDPTILKRARPAMANVRPRETAAFEQALATGFQFVAREGSFELSHRRAGITDSVCAAIVE